MATRREVERKLRELIERLDGAGSEVQGSLSRSLPDGRIIEVVVTDLDESWWTEVQEGRLTGLRSEVPDRADIRIKVASEHLVDLVDGRRSLFSSYLGGQVRLEASFSDLMRLRKLA